MKKILLIFFLIYSSHVFSATMFHPDLKWKSIKTDHFWIHYHQGLELESNKLAIIAERVHKQLSQRIGWQPTLRTDVVLVDNMYTANGFATPFPFNRIQIYLSRPELDSSLNNFDNWLELVFLHEYVHILNIDTIHGIPSLTRYTFGRCCFPNLFLPIWMLEGNAVYHESGYSKFGRNNSTYTDMIMRTEIASNSFKSISEASHYPRTWPVGQVPYLYGGLFVEFLEKKYGTGSFAKVFIDNSYNLIPYEDNTIPYILPFIDTSAEKIYRDTFITLWKEWEEFLKIKYTREVTEIKKEQLTEHSQITTSGHLTFLPRFDRKGENIFYIRHTNYDKTALMSYSLASGKHKILCQVNDPNSISVANDNQIYLSDAEFFKTFSIYNEAFVYNKSYNKITSRLRGSYIDIYQNQKTAFVMQDNGKFSLILSDPLFTSFESLISQSDIQIAFTRFSPDGQRIVFTIKDKTGNADIAIFDIVSGEILRLNNDEYNDIHPSWHPDGKRIIFSSDRDGVYNLYEYDLDKMILSKITNFIGGSFSPDISPDGKSIVFAHYGKNGFDISMIEYPNKPITSENIIFQNIPMQFFNQSKDEAIIEKKMDSDYTVLHSVFPPLWLPLIGSSEVYKDKEEWILGFFTLGTDALYKNMYMINSYAYTYEKRASVNINYLFSYLYPDIIIEYYNDTLFYGEDEFPWKGNSSSIKREMERSGIIGLAIPFYFYHSYHIFSFSYKYSKSYTDIYIPNISQRFKDTEARIRAKYSYNNANEYAYSISKEDGRDFYIISDLYKKEIGSDISYSKTRAEYVEYLPGIWENNVFMIRFRGGASFCNPDYKPPYNLGRFKKGDTGIPETDEDEFGLRGYPLGKIYGNRIATGTTEYRLPVIQADFGFATFPLMFRDLWLTPFFEYGNVWKEDTNIKEFKSSAGIELNLRITVGYAINLQGYIGYAKGFNKYGEDQVYFAVSTLFEGALKNNYKWLDYL